MTILIEASSWDFRLKLPETGVRMPEGLFLACLIKSSLQRFKFYACSGLSVAGGLCFPTTTALVRNRLGFVLRRFWLECTVTIEGGSRQRPCQVLSNRPYKKKFVTFQPSRSISVLSIGSSDLFHCWGFCFFPLLGQRPWGWNLYLTKALVISVLAHA